MPFLPFLKIFPVLLVALISPGPSFVLLSNLSLSRGRLAGLQCAAGYAVSDLIFSVLTLFGLGLLVTETPGVMGIIKYAGGLYLMFVGYQILRTTFHTHTATNHHAPTIPSTKPFFILGLLTNLSNPKTIVFYASIFTYAIDTHTDALTKTLLSVYCCALSMLWYGFVAIVLSDLRLRARYLKRSHLINRGVGTILFLFGIKLVLSGGQ
jgi:threonine/homoserine/homoserine lactone efflux protein